MKDKSKGSFTKVGIWQWSDIK